MDQDKLASVDGLMAQFRERLVADAAALPGDGEDKLPEPVDMAAIDARVAAVREGMAGAFERMQQDVERRQRTARERAKGVALASPVGLLRLFPGLRP